MRSVRLLLTLILIFAGASPAVARVLPALVASSYESESETPGKQAGSESNAVCSERSPQQRSRHIAGTTCLDTFRGQQIPTHSHTAHLPGLPGAEHSQRNGTGTPLLT